MSPFKTTIKTTKAYLFKTRYNHLRKAIGQEILSPNKHLNPLSTHNILYVSTLHVLAAFSAERSP